MHPYSFTRSPADEAAGAACRIRSYLPSHGKPGSERGQLRPLIANSWNRCLNSDEGRDPTTPPPVPLVGEALARHRDQHPLSTTMTICRELLGQAVQDSSCVFAVGDSDGVLLWVEGDRSTRHKAERMHFIEGALWSESQAGTNAPGTALAVGGPVQIVADEHYNEAVRTWSCAAAPIRDPDSGRLLGVIDITGGQNVASPHTLALVRATATAVEDELSRRLAVSDVQAREAYASRAQRSNLSSALVSHSGRVLETDSQLDLDNLAGLTCGTNGSGTLPDGRRLVIEPVGTGGYVVVRFVEAVQQQERRAAVRLTALGRDSAIMVIDGRTVKLSPRQSEIVVLLALADEGLSAGRLAVDLSLDDLSNATIRVDMSRLRGVLGDDLLGSRPYLLRRPVRSDVHVARDLLAEGRVRDALGIYAGPLLPTSQAPTIVEHRTALELQLRGAVLASRDAWLLRRWVNASWGADDLLAWDALARLLPAGSPQRAAVVLRAQALRGDPR